MYFTTNDQEIIKDFLIELGIIEHDSPALEFDDSKKEILFSVDPYGDERIIEALNKILNKIEFYLTYSYRFEPGARGCKIAIENIQLDRIYRVINYLTFQEESKRKKKPPAQTSEPSEIELIEIQSQESIREKLDKVKDKNRKYISDLTLSELNSGYVIYNFRNPGYIYHDCPHDSAWFISKNAVYCVTSAKEMLLAIKDGYHIYKRSKWTDVAFAKAFKEIDDQELQKILSYNDSAILNMPNLPVGFLVEYFNEYRENKKHKEFVEKIPAALLARISQWQDQTEEFFIKILSDLGNNAELKIKFITQEDANAFAEKCAKLSNEHKNLVPKYYQQAIESQIGLNQQQGIDGRLIFLSKMAEELSDNDFEAELLRWHLDSLFKKIKNEKSIKKHDTFIAAYKKLKPNNQSVLSYYLLDENVELFKQLSTGSMEITFDQCQNKFHYPDYERIKRYNQIDIIHFFGRNTCDKTTELTVIQKLELHQVFSQYRVLHAHNQSPIEQLEKIKNLLGEQSIERYQIYCEKNVEYRAALEIKKAMQWYLTHANAWGRFWANPSQESKEFAQNVVNTKENSTILASYQADKNKNLGSTMRGIVTKLDKNPAIMRACEKQTQS